MTYPLSSTFAAAFVRRLQSAHTNDEHHLETATSEIPAYNCFNPADLKHLLQQGVAQSFTLGTGASIFTQTLLPAILSAQHEVILVTCFWAPSKTLTALSRALEELAEERQAQQAQTGSLPPLRVRICLSSTSFFQKLFHTSSDQGYQYPPTAWSSKLGLPSAEVLRAGNIDLRVKSLFFLPFSVMHPKFLIVDQQRAFLPSCNVSWESWLEGCIEVTRSPDGVDDAIDGLLEFYKRVWDREYEFHRGAPRDAAQYGASTPSSLIRVEPVESPAHITINLQPAPISTTKTIWLPSSHHRNPRFRLFPWLSTPPPPPTPLNIALQQLFETAHAEIYIQTPDFTSAPALDGILEALKRGVNVTIVTSRDMKIHEQLLTAGTTTTWCVRRLVAQYRKLSLQRISTSQSIANRMDDDLEAQLRSLGRLKVAYFRPRRGIVAEEEPIHSHLKLTIIDDEFTVLGSGNMDRASWYTSQELGVLFQSNTLAGLLQTTVQQITTGRLDFVYESKR